MATVKPEPHKQPTTVNATDVAHRQGQHATPVEPHASTALATAAWTTVVAFGFVLSLWASWMTLKPVDFGYGFLHQVFTIDRVIKQFAPNNLYRDHFELTTPAEQKRLFHEIVIAIHDDPARLATITYHTTDGKPIDTLLREPEIVHLEDVNVLIHRFFKLCIALFGLTLGLLWFIRRKSLPFPGMGKIIGRLLITLIVITALIMLIGPTKVFYQLHIWLFPAENQWFFYYKESLMTTLMIAPIIFGPIAVFLVITSLPYAVAFILLTRTICRPTQNTNTSEPNTTKTAPP